MICRPDRVGEIEANAAYCEGANQKYLLPLKCPSTGRLCICGLRLVETTNPSASIGLAISSSELH
jgi:hypothetical protein